MNNDEIRLSILHQHYRATFNGKAYGRREEAPELKDVSHNIINANEKYLIEKNLINGEVSYTSSGAHAFTADIAAWGMDVVEQIMNESLNELDPKINAEIKKEDSTDKKLQKFYEGCVKLAPMCEVAGKIFLNL